MFDPYQQQKNVQGSLKRASIRKQAYYKHPKTQSLNEIPAKTLEHHLFSFQDLQGAKKNSENQNVQKDLSNFKKYLNESPTFQKKVSEVRPRAESFRSSKVIDDHQTLMMKEKLENKISQARRILEEMKEGLKIQQMKKHEIISHCDMRRSHLRDSSIT